MNPQDDDADLMDKIRHQADETVLSQNGTGADADVPAAVEGWPSIPDGDFPLPPAMPALAACMAFDPVPLAEAETLVPRAKEKMAVNPRIPGFLRPMFRNQGGFNGILLQTCGRLVEASQHLQQENVHLRARLNAMAEHLTEQNLWLAALAQTNTEDRRWRRAVQGQLARQEQRIDGRSNRMEIRLDRAEGLIDGLVAGADEQGGALARVETQFELQQAWVSNIQALADEQTASLAELDNPGQPQGETAPLSPRQLLERHGQQIRELSEQGNQHAQHLQTADARLDHLGEHLGRVEEGAVPSNEHIDRLGTLQRRVDEAAESCNRARGELAKAISHQDLLEAGARQLAERQINDSSFLRSQLTFQQRLLAEWLDAPARATGSQNAPNEGTPAPNAQAPAAERIAAHKMDALYLASENTRRGDRGAIKERMRIYLPYLQRNELGSEARPVLDLGCGRGEWLEVLRDEGLHASGIDLNACMIDECRERGLNAAAGDALERLASLADASCGAVTAFHLIEHLPFPVLVKFFTECLRVLQPGGLAIFETPNPTNVLVGACTFYSDFTHQRPLPPDSTRFLVEHLGFAEAEIVALHPRHRSDMVAGDGTNEALILRFNELFYGPQDYAIVARAASAGGSQ